MPQLNSLQEAARSLCATTRAQYRLYSLRAQEISHVDSALADFGVAVTRQLGPAGPWTKDLGLRLSTNAHLYMTMAEQHLSGLECLIESGFTGISLGPIARSVAEASGRAGWLLDPNLAIGRKDTRRRVARYLLDDEENKRLYKRVSYEFSHPERAKAGDSAKRAKDAVRKPGTFYSSEIAITPRTGKLALCDQILPGPSGFVRFAGALFGDEPHATSGFYSYVSAMTHPTIYAFAETLMPIDQLPPGTSEFPYRNDGEFALKLAGNSVRAFHNLWRLWISWTGTGHAETDVVHEAHKSAMTNLSSGSATT